MGKATAAEECAGEYSPSCSFDLRGTQPLQSRGEGSGEDFGRQLWLMLHVSCCGVPGMPGVPDAPIQVQGAASGDQPWGGRRTAPAVEEPYSLANELLFVRRGSQGGTASDTQLGRGGRRQDASSRFETVLSWMPDAELAEAKELVAQLRAELEEERAMSAQLRAELEQEQQLAQAVAEESTAFILCLQKETADLRQRCAELEREMAESARMLSTSMSGEGSSAKNSQMQTGSITLSSRPGNFLEQEKGIAETQMEIESYRRAAHGDMHSLLSLRSTSSSEGGSVFCPIDDM